MFGFGSDDEEESGFVDQPDDREHSPEPDSQSKQPSAPDPREASLTGDEYQVTVDEVERAGEYEVKAHTADEGPVAGKKVRRMFERAAKQPERPLWIGYDDSARNGFREAPIMFRALRRHLWISGTTGSGKTTQMQNKAVQHAYGGHGFCNIDPKASGDTIELLQQLPAHRLDDVILLEPGSPAFEKTIAINMLDMPAIEDETRREKEIESRLENLVAIFDNDEYWGVNMQAVTESMGRAMLRHNAEISLADGDPSEKYSVIDMYFILLNAERREEFAEEVDDPYLKEFLYEIAEMDDDDLRPLTKRIKSWVENAVVRKIIARRESTIDWDDIVDNDRILLVRIPVDSEDVHQMITLTVLRNLWSAKKRQDRNPERETKPYFLQVDEFEKVANDNLAVEDMLVRARSMWLSVTLGTQYPFQIEKDHEGVMRAMTNNCNSLLAMRTPGNDDARLLMERFEGYSATDLSNTNYYRTWTKIPLEGGRESEPVNIMNFAPYPPLRSEDDVMEIIRESLDQWGAEPLSDAEIQRELKYGEYNEVVDPAAAPGAEFNPDTAALAGDGRPTVEDLPTDTILEGVYAAQVQEADAETLVDASRATAEIEKRLGDTGYQSQLSNAFEDLEVVKLGRRSGEVVVGLTPEGRTRVFSADTGSSASGGGDDHRYILQEAFRAFTSLGALTRLPTQEGEELPDGVADLPVDPLDDADTVEEVHELEAKLQEEYPELYELAGARDIAIEAETSTIKKPMQTLTNLRKAIESNRLCVFACKDATAEGKGFTYWPQRGEKIIFDVDGNEIDYGTVTCVADVDDTDQRTFYNKTSKFQIDEECYAVRPDSDERNPLTWHEDGSDIVATAKDGYEAARFSSADAVGNPSPTEVRAYRTKTENDEWVVQEGSDQHGPYGSLDELREEWQDLYAPFIPENEFPREPTVDDFEFVVFPDDDNAEFDEPMIYWQGELRPLHAADTAPTADSTGASRPAGGDEAPVASDTSSTPSAGDTATDTAASAAGTPEETDDSGDSERDDRPRGIVDRL